MRQGEHLKDSKNLNKQRNGWRWHSHSARGEEVDGEQLALEWTDVAWGGLD